MKRKLNYKQSNHSNQYSVNSSVCFLVIIISVMNITSKTRYVPQGFKENTLQPPNISPSNLYILFCVSMVKNKQAIQDAYYKQSVHGEVTERHSSLNICCFKKIQKARSTSNNQYDPVVESTGV